MSFDARMIVCAAVLHLTTPASGQVEYASESADSSIAEQMGAPPTPETTSALLSLQSRINSGLPSTGGEIIDQPLDPADFVAGSLNVRASELTTDVQDIAIASSDGGALVPFIIPDTMYLKFSPDVGDDLWNIIEENELNVVKVLPNLSIVVVDADVESFFRSEPGDNSNNEALMRGVINASSYYQSLDSRIIGATPDFFVRSQNFTNMLEPSEVTATAGDEAEIKDWGVSDIEADLLWTEEGAQDGVVLGILDSGFARHEDLVFLRVPGLLKAHDHGNHVAGIICGRHNGKGTMGVVPNCFVRPQSASSLGNIADGGNIMQYVVAWGDITTAFDRLLDEESSIKAFNVSMGYNWIPNFAINPDGSASALWRDMVRVQGPFVLSVLARAERTGQVIFSAAGNDSSSARRISSEFASPMNWGAKFARDRGLPGGGFGVVVEAHDKTGSLAAFSNTEGHISCPGVDVKSAVAFDSSRSPTDRAYGFMSGTSMASPYCAGGFTLLSLIEPDLTPLQILGCMVGSGTPSSSGTPMLRLSSALSMCRAIK